MTEPDVTLFGESRCSRTLNLNRTEKYSKEQSEDDMYVGADCQSLYFEGLEKTGVGQIRSVNGSE